MADTVVRRLISLTEEEWTTLRTRAAAAGMTPGQLIANYLEGQPQIRKAKVDIEEDYSKRPVTAAPKKK